MFTLLTIPLQPSNQVILNVTEHMWIVVGMLISILYLKFLWNRRKLYEHAKNIPGPTTYPIIGCALEFAFGKPFDILHSIVLKYPKGVVRFWFGPKLIFGIFNPKYVEILLNSKFALTKGDGYKMIQPLFGPGIFTANVPKWKRLRRLILPAFGLKNLEHFVEIFNKQAIVLNEVFEDFVDLKEFNVINPISKCTLEIICETAINVKIGAQQTNPDFEKWIARSAEILCKRLFNIFYHLDFIFFNTPHGREFQKVIDHAQKFVKERVIKARKEFEENQRQKKGNPTIEEDLFKKKAFLDLLLEQTHKEQSFLTDDEFLYETMAFIVAGYHTTANTLGFIFLLLGIHQEVQDTVLNEIIEVIGPDRDVLYTDLRELTYLERVIKESQRLFPVASLMERAVEEDINLDDYTIPKGSYVVFSIVETHRSPFHWPDPLKFDPERFSPENVTKIEPGAYIPFSHGPRNCAGPVYAMMSMKSLLATVLRKYRIKTPYKNVEDIKLKYSLGLQPEHGYNVSLELR